ncbi:putative protein TPRXL [Hypomesus transpacificus]|uniref:putative protein TPRXL n=1 Tax=Hypomesus transpacificus TaxID=137520 RepID=UPI001F0718D1|nr:putative protein TPRXL [Hypomesus transpacificus]
MFPFPPNPIPLSQPNTPPAPPASPPPPPPNPHLTHPLVTSGRISVDLAHLLTEIKYKTGKVRRNVTKTRLLTAQEMSDVIEEAEDRAAMREAQALARPDSEQQRVKDRCSAATSSTLSGGSRPCRRRQVSLGAPSTSSSGLSMAGPSTHSAPSCASHGPWLPASTTSQSLPAEEHGHLPPSTASKPADAGPSSSSSSAGPTTSTGHTPEDNSLGVWPAGNLTLQRAQRDWCSGSSVTAATHGTTPCVWVGTWSWMTRRILNVISDTFIVLEQMEPHGSSSITCETPC